ncbi:MAG: NAD(P)H-dependent oxidoreductase [Tannerella sp.]|jgi:glutathione-regulated potassium-efflux system ancillary protein KefG|nr:NAD(P)H-dependent oxidoreductase [Tannerella sp.]
MKTNRRKFLETIGAGTMAFGLSAVENSVSPFQQVNETNQDNKKLVILLTHPNFKDSKANKALIEAVNGLNGITVINLYDAPFTVDTYKSAVSEADTVVFQFPFYWASAPSQLKKWCDEIFAGLTAAIKGKKLMVATTTGSEYEAYRSGGRNQFTMDELLRPYQLLANHSGMIWQTPFVVYGASLPSAAQSINEGAVAYKNRIQSFL